MVDTSSSAAAETKAKAGMKTSTKLLIVFGILFTLLCIAAPSTYNYAVNTIYNPVKLLNLESDRHWAEVENQYQRRADLLPNLVAIVGLAAGHENQTLKEVIEARAKASSVQLTADALKDPQAMAQFSKVQGDITTALSRMMMLTENYPQLKANENFLSAQAQIEGTENRIAVARHRYINSVAKANEPIVTWPGNLFASFLGLKERPQFMPENAKANSVAPVIQGYQRKD